MGRYRRKILACAGGFVSFLFIYFSFSFSFQSLDFGGGDWGIRERRGGKKRGAE